MRGWLLDQEVKPGPTTPRVTHGWRRARGEPSLREVWGSIPVAGNGWRKLFAFLGPGYLVSVGYMDPGNWATSLAGGAQFGYTLLVIALISNVMAILLQALCARLGFATGRDLAQACRDAFPKPISLLLWVLAEILVTQAASCRSLAFQAFQADFQRLLQRLCWAF